MRPCWIHYEKAIQEEPRLTPKEVPEKWDLTEVNGPRTLVELLQCPMKDQCLQFSVAPDLNTLQRHFCEVNCQAIREAMVALFAFSKESVAPLPEVQKV